jgi:carbamoyl-phosphate synthase large subunit
MAAELQVVGLMNVQYAIKDGQLYVLEVNPASLADGAVRQQGHRRAAGQAGHQGDAGQISLAEAGLSAERVPQHVSVKEAVLPFNRFPNVDTLLGPGNEIHRGSDGDRRRIRAAYAKAQLGAGQKLPTQGGFHQRQRPRQVRGAARRGPLPRPLEGPLDC